jgi:DNA-binding XRE family transcriptional regulator
MSKNRLRNYRESQLLTKAELARRAGISTLTIDRIEAGMPCRIDTKRKIILALGLKVQDKRKIFVDAGPNAVRQKNRGSTNGAR